MMYDASTAWLSKNCWMLERFVDQIETTWNCVVGCGSPYLEDMRRAMTAMPKAGDLVLIIHAGNAPLENRLGWLMRVEDVPWRPAEGDEEFSPLQRQWVIDRIDGSGEFTWHNVAVLRVIRENREDALVPITRPVPCNRPYFPT